MSNLFPKAKQAAVERALMAAFGTAELEGSQPLSGGLSGAGVWRIRVGGIDYLLRMTHTRDALSDPARGFACMRTAAAACLAPAVRYADVADGVAISDFIQPLALSEYPGSGPGLVTELARTVRRLHETPAFPPLVDYLEGLDGLIDPQFRSNLLDPAATVELFTRYSELRAEYRTRQDDLVSGHNDLNPGNIIYDGQRLWLVDWEAAFLADRYVDLATVANWFTSEAAAGEMLLTTYFGRAPQAHEVARFQLMRLVNHIFVGVIFLNVTAAEQPGLRLDDRSLAGPSLEQLRQRLRAGEFDMMMWDNRVTYGKARLSAALENLQSPACADALARIADD